MRRKSQQQKNKDGKREHSIKRLLSSESIWGNSVFSTQYVWMKRTHKRSLAHVLSFFCVYSRVVWTAYRPFGCISLLKHPHKWHSRVHYTVANVRTQCVRLQKCKPKREINPHQFGLVALMWCERHFWSVSVGCRWFKLHDFQFFGW